MNATFDYVLRDLDDRPLDFQVGQRAQIMHSWIERKPDDDEGEHYCIVHILRVHNRSM